MCKFIRETTPLLQAHTVITPRGPKALSSSLKFVPFAYLFNVSRHCMCAKGGLRRRGGNISLDLILIVLLYSILQTS